MSGSRGSPCTTPQLAEGNMVDLWRDFWIRETGTGQQVAQLHERYDDDDDDRRRVSQLKTCDFSGEAYKGFEML